MEKERVKIRDLLAREQVFAPCIYDSLSARAVELSGFKAMLLSGGALSWAMCGVPDMGLMSTDELVWATYRIAQASPLPMIIDVDDGYGPGPLQTYRTVKRLADAGAMGVTIDDSTTLHGSDHMLFIEKMEKHDVVPREEFYAKIKAAVEACKGTDCIVIARSEAMLQYGIDEAIERLVKCRELGADMTMVIGIKTIEHGRYIAERDPGWKMWPDVGVTDGRSDVELDEIAELGFNLVTMHYTEQGAMAGMLKFGNENFKNRSSVYSELHPIGGETDPLKKWEMIIDYKRWVEMYNRFRDV